MDKTIHEYCKKIKKIVEKGDYTEYSFRSSFEEFLGDLFSDYPSVSFEIIHEPTKKKGVGFPDFIVKSDGKIVGHIETKNIDVNIHKLPKKDAEQIDKYKKGLENVILTNYRNFILYQNGENISDVPLVKDDLKPDNSQFKDFEYLVERFTTFSMPEITSPEALAIYLAKKARLMKDIVLDYYEDDEYLIGLFETLKNHLMSSLTVNEFADTYAQTIAYGLFMAKLNIRGELTRGEVILRGIPNSLEVVQKTFSYIAGTDLPKYLEWIVDDAIKVLNNVNVDDIFRDGNGEDPFIYFYEEFLAKYDERLRRSKGVYYTPLQVVNFIVNSVNLILRNKFNKRFFDENLRILDPAVGTGTFIAQIVNTVRNETRLNSGNQTNLLFETYLHDRLIKNLYGFEILIAPYLVSHIKLSTILRQMNVALDEDERFQFFLTNTLDLMRKKEESRLPIEIVLDKESEEADKIKKESDIFVVLGNPPYESKGDETYIQELLKDYLQGLGVENEVKKGVIQDEYVKFIRFAQNKIEQSGRGIVAFITNYSYLDGIVHRRMRQCLMETFDEIYILNLHGSTRRNEPDENVFDIQQGVCIGIFVKLNNNGRHKAEECNVYHYSTLKDSKILEREHKYNFLNNNTVENIEWTKLHPEESNYFFTPRELRLKEEYESYPKLDEIFDVFTSGVETHKDKVALAFTPERIEERIQNFLELDENTLRKKYDLRDSSEWPLSKVMKDLKEDFGTLNEDFEKIKENRIKPIYYKPFDIRWTYFYNKSKSFIARPRYDIMKHMILGENIALCTSRQVFNEFDTAFVTPIPICARFFAAQRTNKTYMFPLYTYTEDRDTGGFIVSPNIKKEFLDFIEEEYNATPEEFMYYIYAILHDSRYRETYTDFLKDDYPRIPLFFKKVFEEFKEIGRELVELHLMRKRFGATPKIVGSSRKIKKVNYDGENERIHINETSYLDSIPKNVWEFIIGGCQVLDTYLKYRKGRELSISELEHIYEVVEIIKETIRLQNKLKEIEA